MKRFFAIICVLFAACFFVTGCGDDGGLFELGGIGRNFPKSEFDGDYTVYEDALEVPKKAKTISIIGHVTSGTIELKLIEKDKDGKELQAFEFTITDNLNETVKLEKKHSSNWVIISEHFEDTDGGFEASVFG